MVVTLDIHFDLPALEAKRPQPLTKMQREAASARIKKLLKQEDAVLIAHYYTDPDCQALADETGGFVSDSLEMARFGKNHPAKTLVICGVRFMGETAKILSPEKRVLMPTLEAECSLDLSCPIDEFSNFCDKHPERTVVVYANTSAVVKARSDWVVTSSIALEVVDYLDSQGKKILWAPDRHLGRYIQLKTQADMLIWQGICVVHDAFKSEAVRKLKKQYSDAAVLVHPESPEDVIAMADHVGSTTALIKAVQTLKNPTFIVATDKGIFYKMQQMAPDKKLIEVPTGGTSATCVSCAHCPWMALNGLDLLANVFNAANNEILLPIPIMDKARVALNRMLDFREKLGR